jgi:hypothetical protein
MSSIVGAPLFLPETNRALKEVPGAESPALCVKKCQMLPHPKDALGIECCERMNPKGY